MRYEIRKFEGSDVDWAAYTRIHNQAWPDYLTTEEEARYEDTRWNAKYRRERYLIERDGFALGFGLWCEPAWSPREGKYYLDWCVDPQAGNGADAALGGFLRSRLLDLDKVDTLETEAREDQSDRLVWLENHGFAPVQRENCSAIALSTFDPAPFRSKCLAAQARGFRILNHAQLAAQYDDWFEPLYALNTAIVVDLPAPEPVVPESRQRFESRFARPGFVAEGYFVAMDGDLPVGLSTLHRSLAEPRKLYVGLTGVRREYRRRGLCTALKVHALQWAQSEGFERVVTDNEANNPMYDINVALGFVPMPQFIVFHAEVAS